MKPVAIVRRGSTQRPQGWIRRTAVWRAGVVAVLAVILGVAGLQSAGQAAAGPGPTTVNCARDSGATVHVLHAGSLTNLVTLSLGPSFLSACGATVTDQSGPAVGLADGIKDGTLTGDVYLSADAHVNQTLMGPDNGDWVRWYLTFARNEEVISYTPKSRFFADLEKARLGQVPWYQVLMEPGFVLGRTDPNTDPGGYYALFVAELAQRFYHIPDLKQRLLGSDTNPQQLLTPPSFTTTASGAVPDATFGYLSSAIDKHLSYLALPPQINLGVLDQAKRYATVSFTNKDGNTFRGAPIYDSVTVLQRTPNHQVAVDFVHFLLTDQGHAFVLSRGFLPSPILVGGDPGAVPTELKPYIDGCYLPRRCDRG